MTNKLEIHGLDLTGMGIGDCVVEPDHHDAMVAMSEHFVRQILGSITFGPVQFVDLPDPEDEDDGDWEYAE